VFKNREILSLYAYRFRRNPLSIVGGIVVLSFVLCAIFAPYLTPYDPEQLSLAEAFEAPSAKHPLGTNDTGMDVLARVIYATRVDLYIAVWGVSLAIVIGTVVGAIVGYYGTWIDTVVMRFLDSQQAFPSLLLAVAIAAALGPNMRNVIIVLAIVNYPMYARLVRAQVMSLKNSQYVLAAKTTGNTPLRIIFRHLLPNSLGPVYVQGSLNAGWAVLIAASLSYLGLGVQLPTPEWGVMIARGSRYITTGEWWMAIFPGMAIFLIVLGFNLLGDGLQDVFDPKRQ